MVCPFLPNLLPRLKAQSSAELFNASRRGNWDRVEELLSRGADPNVYSNSCQTSALMVAVQKSSVRGCESLLRCRADVNHADKSGGLTALMYGCKMRCPADVICVLLEGRADVDAR